MTTNDEETKQQIQEIFNQIDENNDQLINLSEFIIYCNNYFNTDPVEVQQYICVFVVVYDLCKSKSLFNNKNEYLSIKEFRRIYSAFPPYTNQSKRARIGTFFFNIINEKRNGIISEKEMWKFTSLLGMKRKDNKEFINEIDSTGNGKIDLNEFLSWYVDGMDDYFNEIYIDEEGIYSA